MPLQIVQALIGAVLLVAGRPLYWAFVGIAGFLVAANLTNVFLAAQDEWVQILVAVLAGVIGAVTAVAAQRLAFSIAGFFAGGYLGWIAAESLAAAEAGQLTLFVAGGVIGAIIAALLMDWAIIGLSSLLGAGLIVDVVDARTELVVGLFAALTLIGAAVQGGVMHRMRARRPKERVERSAG